MWLWVVTGVVVIVLCLVLLAVLGFLINVQLIIFYDGMRSDENGRQSEGGDLRVKR